MDERTLRSLLALNSDRRGTGAVYDELLFGTGSIAGRSGSEQATIGANPNLSLLLELQTLEQQRRQQQANLASLQSFNSIPAFGSAASLPAYPSLSVVQQRSNFSTLGGLGSEPASGFYLLNNNTDTLFPRILGSLSSPSRASLTNTAIPDQSHSIHREPREARSYLSSHLDAVAASASRQESHGNRSSEGRTSDNPAQPSRATSSTGALPSSSAIYEEPRHEEESESSRVTKRSRPPPQQQQKDKPKRPLSAYNIFFKEERMRLFESVTAEQNERNRKEGNHTRSTKKAKISFENLAKIIGGRWRELDSSQVDYYKEKANADMQRYRLEMEEYNSRQCHAEGGQEANTKEKAMKRPKTG